MEVECQEERCVLCGNGEVEDVEHFLTMSEELQWEREKLFELSGEVEGVCDWMEAFHRAGKEERPGLLVSTSC